MNKLTNCIPFCFLVISWSSLFPSGLAGQEWTECNVYPNDYALLRKIEQGEFERKLYAFCQRGIIGQTGIACSPFGYAADEWLVNSLLKEERFQEALKRSKDTITYQDNDPPSDEKPGSDYYDSDFYKLFQSRKRFRASVLASLNADQLKKLPGIYLRLEGMMALCRPEFTKIFDAPERQAIIRKIVIEVFDKRVSQMISSLGRIEDTADVIFIQSQLKKLSADLDCKIVLALSKAEREKLLGLINDSRSLDDFYGCPIVR